MTTACAVPTGASSTLTAARKRMSCGPLSDWSKTNSPRLASRRDRGGGTMPAHIKHEPGALLIVLNRDGEEPQTRRAVGGEQALLFAISMLIRCRQLPTDDLLKV